MNRQIEGIRNLFKHYRSWLIVMGGVAGMVVVLLVLMRLATLPHRTVSTIEITEEEKSRFFIPDGATRVRYDPGIDQSVFLSFVLQEDFPAENVIADFSSHLEEQGWEPLEYDFLNPDTPSSHVRGWTSFIDGTRQPKERVHQWKAQWRNDQGDTINYTLQYRYPWSGSPDLNELWVMPSWHPAR